MSDRSQAVNALIGAAVTVVLTFIPFSSVLGGAVAGYLQGGELRDGLTVGALSGLFATVPLLIFLFLVGGFVSLGLLGLDAPRLLAFGGAIVLFVFLVSMVYLIGFSAIGGAVGAAVKRNPDIDPQAED